MATIFYARVSTKDQTIEHQRTQAAAAGFKIDRVVSDHGISGISTRLAERPEGKRLFDILRSGDTLVVRWVGGPVRSRPGAAAKAMLPLKICGFRPAGPRRAVPAASSRGPR